MTAVCKVHGVLANPLNVLAVLARSALRADPSRDDEASSAHGFGGDTPPVVVVVVVVVAVNG